MDRCTPAGQLVTAFGDVDAMQRLYAEDIEWSLPLSLLWPRPIVGKDAVVSFNKTVWTDNYFPDCSVTILDEIGDETRSAVRFVYRARFCLTGKPYENEYTLFVRSRPDGIHEVFEAMDSLSIIDQFDGQQPGTALTRFHQEHAPV